MKIGIVCENGFRDEIEVDLNLEGILERFYNHSYFYTERGMLIHSKIVNIFLRKDYPANYQEIIDEYFLKNPRA